MTARIEADGTSARGTRRARRSGAAREVSTSARFVRDFACRGQRLRLVLDTRGCLYRLEPPVVVDVLEGTTQGCRPRIASVERALADGARWAGRLATRSARAALHEL